MSVEKISNKNRGHPNLPSFLIPSLGRLWLSSHPPWFLGLPRHCLTSIIIAPEVLRCWKRRDKHIDLRQLYQGPELFLYSVHIIYVCIYTYIITFHTFYTYVHVYIYIHKCKCSASTLPELVRLKTMHLVLHGHFGKGWQVRMPAEISVR